MIGFIHHVGTRLGSLSCTNIRRVRLIDIESVSEVFSRNGPVCCRVVRIALRIVEQPIGFAPSSIEGTVHVSGCTIDRHACSQDTRALVSIVVWITIVTSNTIVTRDIVAPHLSMRPNVSFALIVWLPNRSMSLDVLRWIQIECRPASPCDLLSKILTTCQQNRLATTTSVVMYR